MLLNKFFFRKQGLVSGRKVSAFS